MPTVNFKILSKKNPANIYCRFLHTRSIDIKIPIGVYVNPKSWDAKNQKIKHVIADKNKEAINRKLAQLKIEITDNFNMDYINGEVIDRHWLEKVIAQFFKRPSGELNYINKLHTAYLVPFSEWWMENKSSTWVISSGNYMNKLYKSYYLNVISLIKDFQGKSIIKLNKDANRQISDFIKWLSDEGYSEKTIRRHVGRVKFFYARAKEEGFSVDNSFEKRLFIPKSEEVLEPYLSPEEIDVIFNLKIDNKSLDDARDNLIIACWTGLRVSDYLNKLNINNFIDGFIDIKTTKTKKRVSIPVHPMVEKILIKHKGSLPKKMGNISFNIKIKEVCRLAGLNQKMKGKLYDSKIKRKVFGSYEKYKLISSHIGRRSFATNHFGKISNSVIMGVCGWSKEEMLFTYVQKSNREDAIALKKHWESILKSNENE